MRLIAHAITPAPRPRVAVSGLRGRPLEWLESAGLGIWSTRWDTAEPLAREDVLDHHRVVEGICAATPCLPVRFGTAFADAAAARATLDRRSDALRDALARVSGRCEIAVTLLWREPSGGSAPRPPVAEATGPGRRFLDERRTRWSASEARRRRAAELVERLVTTLAVEPALVWHEICSSERVAVSLAVLSPTDQAADRIASLRRVLAGLSDVTGVVNGPWPPYTFAGIDESGGVSAGSATRLPGWPPA